MIPPYDGAEKNSNVNIELGNSKEYKLFNLENDQYEENDLSKDKKYEDIIKEFYNELLKICDPEKVNKRAKREQLEKIEKNGGIEKIISRGDFGYSPAPGQKKEFD